MEKGKFYAWSSIIDFANENDYSIIEHGSEIIGENFMVLKHNDKDLTVSFILSSANVNGFFYECIYSDLK